MVEAGLKKSDRLQWNHEKELTEDKQDEGRGAPRPRWSQKSSISQPICIGVFFISFLITSVQDRLDNSFSGEEAD